MNQTIYKFFSILLLVTVLSTSFVSTSKVEAFAHEDFPYDAILAKCVTKFVAQEVTASILGIATTALIAIFGTKDSVLGVPTGSSARLSGQSVQGGQGMTLTFQQFLKQSADCAANLASKYMIKQMNKQTRAWIKEGLGGVPFATPNLKKLLSDYAQLPANELKRQVAGFNLCDFDGNNTYKNRLGNSIILSTRQNAPTKFENQVECPFPNTSGANSAQDFYGGNFSWAALNNAVQPGGNEFEIAYQMSNELAAMTEETLDAKKLELTYSDGMSGVVDTEGCDYLADYNENDYSPEEWAAMASTYCKTTTPGKVISEQLIDSVKSDMQKLINSDSLAKLIESFVTEQLTNATRGLLK